MPIYEYQAKEGPVKIVKGTIEADNESSAVAHLSARGIVPLSINLLNKSSSNRKSFFFKFKKISVKDIYTFTYQLVELLASGLQLHKSLDTIVEQIEHDSLKDILVDIKKNVREGMSFSESLAIHTKIFGSFYVNMVRAGEASGNLESILTQLAQVYEKEYDFRSRIKQAFAYPILIALCGIGTVVAILTFVIPRLEMMYSDLGKGLPFITVIVIQTSMFLNKFWWVLGIIIVLIYIIINRQISGGRLSSVFFDKIIIKIPLWGRLIQKEEITRFVRSLGLLFGSGVSILESLDVARNILRSSSLKEDIRDIREQVEKGTTLHEAMRNKSNFPPFLISIVTTGEETGSLDRSLMRIAHAYEKDIDGYIKVITTLIEPVLVLIIGSVVGIIVISMLLPIFQINVFVQ